MMKVGRCRKFHHVNILVDLKKAFDTVNISILIKKLELVIYLVASNGAPQSFESRLQFEADIQNLIEPLRFHTLVTSNVFHDLSEIF